MIAHISPVGQRILRLFAEHGDQTYDETVSMADHMLQAASHAVEAGCSDELVTAALLHDIGHLLLAESDAMNAVANHRTDDLRHELVGERFLLEHFPAGVVRPVALHVEAKRYLCALDGEYFGRLSPASVHTLSLQGGPFTDDQVVEFERLQGWQDAVTLRRFDDAAKVVGKATASVEAFLTRLLPTLLPDGGNET